MLDLRQVDLRSLADALEDHAPETSWWFDPDTGASELGLEDPSGQGLIPIEPIPSREAYGDMEDFIGRVRDARARDLLERVIAGRGAFRRFKDTLLEFPELRQAWFAFHDARMERRAIEVDVRLGMGVPASPGAEEHDATQARAVEDPSCGA